MAQNKQALKRRIRSVRSTKKITAAMEMIATAKLAKQKNRMETNRVFANTLYHTFHRVLGRVNLNDVAYFQEKEGPTLFIVFVSDLGLCGAYNSNVIAQIKKSVQSTDQLIIIGSKEAGWLRRNNYNVIEQHSGENLGYGHFTQTVEDVVEKFKANEIAKLKIIYTEFVNSMTFEAKELQLLPITDDLQPKTVEAGEAATSLGQDIIFEPDPETLIEQLVPMLINSMLFSVWMQSKTSEQASRRLAMDNATDNAQELIDDLVMKYNQSRQAAITQEITEIVAGAEAL